MARRILALGAGALAGLIPLAAAACPVCATRDPGGSPTWILLGVMIAVPYAVGAVAFKVIRSVDREDDTSRSDPRDPREVSGGTT